MIRQRHHLLTPHHRPPAQPKRHQLPTGHPLKQQIIMRHFHPRMMQHRIFKPHRIAHRFTLKPHVITQKLIATGTPILPQILCCSMQVIQTITEFRKARRSFGELALVPTMGALHAGHVSLIQIAHQHASHVAVSIFVNPTQFGPHEDFNRYPRPVEQDLETCRQAGVDLVFIPSVADMYPAQNKAQPDPGLATYAQDTLDINIDLPALTTVLEGRHRPGHFKGVCQVVAKLFNIVQPQYACFGQKDYQQLRIISAMVEALNFPLQIIPCPIVREPDGLAMSSRNRYLSPDERTRALSINQSLRNAHDDIKAGIRQTSRLVTSIQRTLLTQHLIIDYVVAVDPETLRSVESVEAPTLLAVAVRAGSTRLIDNTIVTPAPTQGA